MAQGDVHVFSYWVYRMAGATATPSWPTNTIKMGIITNAQTPAITTVDPSWGSAGTTNLSTAEVTPSGNYSAGGITIAGNVVQVSSANTNAVATSPISLAANASNPTGAYWGIFYDSTDTNKRCFAYVDLGGPLSLVNGLNLLINGVGSGAATLLQGTAT